MNAYAAIKTERLRQERLYETGSLAAVASRTDCPPDLKLAALMEEVGEVARAYHDGKELRVELVQVAAVAVAWLESLP